MRTMLFLAAGAAVAASGLATPDTATAQTADGWYGAISGGASLLKDTDGTIANAPTPGSTVRTQNDLDPGFGAQVALGRRAGALRIEGEVGYSRNDQDHYVAITPATGRIFADVRQTSLRAMANAYYDLTPVAGLQPYLGGGVGFSKIDLTFIAPRAPLPTESPRELINDSDTRFTYQVIAGVAAPVTPTLSLTAQYRWLDAGRFQGVDSRGEATERDHRGHSFDIGLRFAF